MERQEKKEELIDLACKENVALMMPLPSIEKIRGSQGNFLTNRIIGTEEHIKVALDVLDKKGGEQ